MRLILLSIVFVAVSGYSQTDTILSFREYIAMVKRHHPAVKQAGLTVSMAEAALLEARGEFDPKIEAEYYTKQYGGKNYYTLANGAFSIPTWFGLELKAGFENNDGLFLNPQNTVPDRGQGSVGVNMAVGQGLFINKRMAGLRRARLMVNQSRAERLLQAVSVLYEASEAYFQWKRQHDELRLYESYLDNATNRFKGLKTLIEAGDRPAIDSVETGIVVRNRLLNLEDSRLKLQKARLELSNFLWASGNTPLELDDKMVPEADLAASISEILDTEALLNRSLEAHPKLAALESKIDILEVDRKLKSNLLLPRLDVSYSWLSEAWDFNNSYRDDYRAGVNFSFPIFLRKERGGLRLARFKVQDARFELDMERLQLSNKIKANQAEISSVERQQRLLSQMVEDHRWMLSSEERLFSFGESSIFLINSRETNLIGAQLSAIAMEYRWLLAHAELFRSIVPAEFTEDPQSR